jgi:hypothetical protein
MEFELEKVKMLFDESEGSVVELERLERLGFLARIIVKRGQFTSAAIPHPCLFTRCWEISNWQTRSARGYLF